MLGRFGSRGHDANNGHSDGRGAFVIEPGAFKGTIVGAALAISDR